MKLPFLFVFVAIALGSCRFSSSEKAISKDVCGCITELVNVNEQIKKSMNADEQSEVMNLFIRAGREHDKARKCILGLSNTYGKLDKKQYDKVLEELNQSCRDGIEVFEKSGWYQEEK